RKVSTTACSPAETRDIGVLLSIGTGPRLRDVNTLRRGNRMRAFWSGTTLTSNQLFPEVAERQSRIEKSRRLQGGVGRSLVSTLNAPRPSQPSPLRQRGD